MLHIFCLLHFPVAAAHVQCVLMLMHFQTLFIWSVVIVVCSHCSAAVGSFSCVDALKFRTLDVS